MLKETEEMYKISVNDRIKCVQKSGKKYIDHLKISDPFRKNCPDEANCFPCKGKDKYSSCKKTNIGYRLWCNLCESRGIEKAYEGESSRNLHIRGKEHEAQYRRKDRNSVMNKHVMEDHEDEKDDVKFDMKVTNNFRKPLSQIKNKDNKTFN